MNFVSLHQFLFAIFSSDFEMSPYWRELFIFFFGKSWHIWREKRRWVWRWTVRRLMTDGFCNKKNPSEKFWEGKCCLSPFIAHEGIAIEIQNGNYFFFFIKPLIASLHWPYQGSRGGDIQRVRSRVDDVWCALYKCIATRFVLNLIFIRPRVLSICTDGQFGYMSCWPHSSSCFCSTH
jgi:hypothetical protein